jgi:hypothetical protein
MYLYLKKLKSHLLFRILEWPQQLEKWRSLSIDLKSLGVLHIYIYGKILVLGFSVFENFFTVPVIILSVSIKRM